MTPEIIFLITQFHSPWPVKIGRYSGADRYFWFIDQDDQAVKNELLLTSHP